MRYPYLQENLEDVSSSTLGQEVESIRVLVRRSRRYQLQVFRSSVVPTPPQGCRNSYEEESQVKVCQRRPGEEELDGVVDELNLKEEHAENALARGPDAPKEYRSVDGGEQRAIQPPTTLRDEFWDLCRGVNYGMLEHSHCNSHSWAHRSMPWHS